MKINSVFISLTRTPRSSAMNFVFRKLQASLSQQAFVFSQTLPVCRAAPSVQCPVWGAAFVNDRQHHSMPTHGIGRWRHLLKKQVKRNKKDQHQMKPIIKATNSAYGTLNVKVSGYDMTLVEHYTQYIHNLCNRLGIKVGLCYALPTKTMEVMLMQEQGTKMYVDSLLKTHERVVQLSSLDTKLCPVFMDVILKNQPEGVQLCVKEHTREDFQKRFKERPELQELMAQMNQ